MYRGKQNVKKQTKILTIISIFLLALGMIGKQFFPDVLNSVQLVVSKTLATADSTVQIAKGDMQVHFIDVGQADCILIQAEGENMLIDAGNNEDSNTVVSYLEECGVSSLTYVIGTHPHEDHIGSLDTVIQTFFIGEVFLPDVVHTTQTYEDVLQAIQEKGLSITEPVAGTSYSLGDATFTIVAPNEDYGDDFNNWSIGIRLVHGDNTFLFCGDAEQEAEEDMCNNGLDLSADVLKVSHHGSNTATSDEFLKAVSPTYAVIMCGKDNSYGHPHQETLQKLENTGITVYRTDIDGTIQMISDGTKISVSVRREDE